jgi:hypothetical protein
MFGGGAALANQPVAPDNVDHTPSPYGTMTTGYTYYNRPGADAAAHAADIKACAAEAMKLHYSGEARSFTYTQPYAAETIEAGVVGGLIGNLIVGVTIANVNHNGHIGAVAAGLENCMVVRGWRVVQLSDAEGQPLAALPQAELAGRITPWVGAQSPPGKVVRVFGNEAASGLEARLGTWPKSGDSVQLSYTAVTGGSLKSFVLYGTQPMAPGMVLNARRPTPMTAAMLPTVADRRAIVILTLKGLGGRTGGGISLERLNAAGYGVDERLLLDQSNNMFNKTTGDTVGLVITAGRWRISAIGDLSFCLGAPAFDAKAGEVLYAGALDLKAARIDPDLSLEAPKAWLGAAPLAAGLKPVQYENGSTGVCGGQVIYALEFQNTPFAAGYAYGSHAAGAPGAAVTTQAQPASAQAVAAAPSAP